MSNLEDLVPPLELCEEIPFPKFENSVFVWDRINQWILQRTEIDYNDEEDGFYVPAPTLQEILEDLPTEIKEETRYLTMYDVRNKERGFQFGYTAFNLAKKKVDQSRIFCAKDDNAVISALKLWMKINKPDEANEANGTNKQKGEQNENGN